MWIIHAGHPTDHSKGCELEQNRFVPIDVRTPQVAGIEWHALIGRNGILMQSKFVYQWFRLPKTLLQSDYLTDIVFDEPVWCPEQYRKYRILH